MSPGRDRPETGRSSPCGQPAAPPSFGDNGTIDDITPSPRSPRRLLDPLRRLLLHVGYDPRHARRVAGVSFALLVLLTIVFGFVLGVSDFSVRLLIGLAAVGAVLGLPLFAVLMAALVHLSLGRRIVRSSPADARAARRVLRSGELTGVLEVDRVARDLAAMVLKQRLWPSVLLLCGLGALNLFNALNRYTSDGAWGGMSVFFLATGLVFVVMVAVAVPTDLLSRRRARAVAETYDARVRSRRRAERPEGGAGPEPRPHVG